VKKTVFGIQMISDHNSNIRIDRMDHTTTMTKKNNIMVPVLPFTDALVGGDLGCRHTRWIGRI
jgi:hypothetical protein